MISKTLKKSKHSTYKPKTTTTLHRNANNLNKNQFAGDNAVIGHYDLVETFKYTMSSLDYTVYVLPKEDRDTMPLTFITHPGVCSTFKSATEVADSAPLQQKNDNQFLQMVKDDNLENDVAANDENSPQLYVDLFDE